MIKVGVIGYPVAHSLSPRIHGHWIRQYGLDATYDAVAIAPEHFTQGIDDLLAQGYAGWNVTLPHKVSMMERCDQVDDTARLIGAVNTVVVQDGRLYGRNTDAYGFIANLDQTHPGWQAETKTTLVIGAGGAARAVVYGLQQAGIDVVLTNRTRARAVELAALLPGVTVLDWDDRARGVMQADLIVNTTSLGMAGQPPLDFSLENAGHSTIVYDIVYRPLMTTLLNDAEHRGLRVVTGLGMLLHQARPAFDAWFGILPAVDAALTADILKGL